MAEDLAKIRRIIRKDKRKSAKLDGIVELGGIVKLKSRIEVYG